MSTAMHIAAGRRHLTAALIPGKLVSTPYKSSRLAPEVLWLERHRLVSLLVQRHHIATPGVVEGGRRPGLAIQVLPACAGDHHPLAEERAISEDFLANAIQ